MHDLVKQFEAAIRAAAWRIIGDVFEEVAATLGVERGDEQAVTTPRALKTEHSHLRGTLPVVMEVLRETKKAMSSHEIVKQAGPRLKTRARLPANIVNRDLAMHLIGYGDRALVMRTAPGRYAWRGEPR